MKVAFLFPGQGSQSVGMGKDICEHYEVAKKVYERANKVLNKNVSKLCFDGPEEVLKETINTQPCIVTNSIALLEALKSRLNIVPTYTAGHSLGEYCAMYASGVMDLDATLKSIQKRAELMNEIKGGSMAAVIKAPQEIVSEVLEEASKVGYVDIANYNSPVQIVITGDKEAVDKAGKLFLEKGVKRFVPLAVSGAFHSKYVQDAGKEFEKYVADIELNDAKIPVVTNVDAESTIKADDFRKKMPKQMYSSVYWTQTIEKMAEDGVTDYIEIGNGSILAGLNKKIVPEMNVYSVYDAESLDNVVNTLGELTSSAY